MSNLKIAEDFCDASARIGSIIHIGGAIADADSLSDSISEFIEEDIFEIDYDLFPIKNIFHENDDFEAWEVVEWLLRNNFLGFLVQIETPVINPKTHTFSWAHYHTRWFYSDDFYSAVGSGLDWVKEKRNAVLAEAMRGER